MNKQKPATNNRIHIGILEINCHIPVLYTFLKICSTPQTQLTIFTTPTLYTRLQTYLTGDESFELILQKENESRSQFLKRVERYTNEHLDVLLINTIHEVLGHLLPFLSFHPQKKTILTIHHVNAWLKQQIVFKPMQPLMTIDTNLSTVLMKSTILNKFDALNVIYSPLKNYIRSHTTNNKPVFTLPTSVYDPTMKPSIEPTTPGLVKIVIPGLIQEQRKDYIPVATAIQNLPKNCVQSLEVCIPGLPVGRFGRTTFQQFKQLEKHGAKVILFNEFVPDDIFNRLMKESDIILCPIRIQTRADNLMPEAYGSTVGSGVIYNGIQYAKPLITPTQFNLLPELSTSSLTYTDAQELTTIFKTLVDHPKQLQHLKKQAIQNAEKFSLNHFQQYLTTTLLPWITETTANNTQQKN